VSETLKKIDRQLYLGERAVVVASLVVMAVVVFLDVVHRTFSGEGSKIAAAIAKVSGMFGRPIEQGSESYVSLVSAAPYFSVVVAVGLGYLGVRTAKRDTPVDPARAAIYAVVGVVVVYGLIRLLLIMLPNGLVWSQPLALVLTLWVGFVGASMCTYENKHLKVEAVQRFLPAKYKPYVGFASGVLTALCCAALFWVSLRYVLFNYDEYVATQGKGGLFLGMDVPRYIGYSALPFSFGVMTARFFANALAALRGEIDDDPTGGLLDNLPKVDEPPPSEVPTEAIAVAGGALRQSDIDTVSAAARRPSDPKPSQINTQPHEVSKRDRPGATAGTLGGSSDDGEADEAEAKADDATEAKADDATEAKADDATEAKADDADAKSDAADAKSDAAEDDAPPDEPPKKKASLFAPPPSVGGKGDEEEGQ
jgi:TRAP-type C4-dicarboxylate transport system permease small subunit